MEHREKKSKADNVFKHLKRQRKGKNKEKKITLGQEYECISGRFVDLTWQGTGLLRTFKPSFWL